MVKSSENISSSTEDLPPLKAPLGLKLLVIGLGVAIIGMLALIIYKIAEKTTNSLAGEKPSVQVMENPEGQQAAMAAGGIKGDYQLTYPAGSSIDSLTVQGTVLIAMVTVPDGQKRVILLNLTTGQQSTVQLVADTGL